MVSESFSAEFGKAIDERGQFLKRVAEPIMTPARVVAPISCLGLLTLSESVIWG